VSFTGHLSGEALHAAIGRARAVVMPSELYENAPISVLEAYALGKPVIGARIGGIPELVREGETGAGFSSGNVESLAQALEHMASLPDGEVEAMGRKARDWVERDFTVQGYRQRILATYRELGVDVSPVRDPVLGGVGA
jgi:glycosyltransferase involved in cell wall biosynthesis